MKDKLILCSSVTYAIKGRDFLKNKGIKTTIKRPPKGGCGCGYCISVREKDVTNAINYLRNIGIAVNEIDEIETLE